MSADPISTDPISEDPMSKDPINQDRVAASHATTGRSKESLHVLTLTPFYPSAADDANGCFVAEPLECLAEQGIRNTVMPVLPFYRARPHSGTTPVPAEWLRYFSWPGGGGLPRAGIFLFAQIENVLRKLHRAEPVDLIHAHGPLPCGHAALLASEKFKIPFVVSVHGLDVFSTVQVTGSAGERCREISMLVYKKACRVICVSGAIQRAILASMGDHPRASVVYNGADPNRFAPATTFPETETILTVGNLIPIKGHELLIRALDAVSKEFPAINLEIIGDGGQRDHLQTLVRHLNLEGRINFRGRQSRAQVAEAMRRCAIFALPSRYEGLGCVYLEAMSCAKPAIGCRGQGIAEIIQNGVNGLLVGTDNEKELAEALCGLLRNPNRARAIGSAARQSILDGLTLKHQAKHLAQIYRECVP